MAIKNRGTNLFKAKHDFIIICLYKQLNLKLNSSKYEIENLHEDNTA